MKVMNILNRKLNHFILLIGRFLTVLEALCFFNRLRTWRLRSQIQRNGHHLRRSCGLCGWSLTWSPRLGRGEKQCIYKSRERKPPTAEPWSLGWGSGGWSWTGRTASDFMGNLWSILSGTPSGPYKREGLMVNVTWWCLEVSPLAWRRVDGPKTISCNGKSHWHSLNHLSTCKHKICTKSGDTLNPAELWLRRSYCSRHPTVAKTWWIVYPDLAPISKCLGPVTLKEQRVCLRKFCSWRFSKHSRKLEPRIWRFLMFLQELWDACPRLALSRAEGARGQGEVECEEISWNLTARHADGFCSSKWKLGLIARVSFFSFSA